MNTTKDTFNSNFVRGSKYNIAAIMLDQQHQFLQKFATQLHINMLSILGSLCLHITTRPYSLLVTFSEANGAFCMNMPTCITAILWMWDETDARIALLSLLSLLSLVYCLLSLPHCLLSLLSSITGSGAFKRHVINHNHHIHDGPAIDHCLCHFVHST